MQNVNHILHRSKTFLDHVKNDVKALHLFLNKSSNIHIQCANAIERQIKSFTTNTISGFFDDPSGICVSFAILRDNFMLFSRFYMQSFSYQTSDIDQVNTALAARINHLKSEGTIKKLEAQGKIANETHFRMEKADNHYKKACKEVEDAIKTKEKAQKDPIYMYDISRQHRRDQSIKKAESFMSIQKEKIIEKVNKFNQYFQNLTTLSNELISDLESLREQITKKIRDILQAKQIDIYDGLENFEQLIKEKIRILYQNKICLDLSAEKEYLMSINGVEGSKENARADFKLVMCEDFIKTIYLQQEIIEKIPQKIESIAQYYSSLFKQRASVIKHFVKLLNVAANQEEILAKNLIKLIKQIKEIKFNNLTLQGFIIDQLEQMLDCHEKMVIFIRKNIIPSCKPIIKECNDNYKSFNEEYSNILKVMKKGGSNGVIYQDLEISFNYDEEEDDKVNEGLGEKLPMYLLKGIFEFRSVLEKSRIKSISSIDLANQKIFGVSQYQRTFSSKMAEISRHQVEIIKSITIENTIEETLEKESSQEEEEKQEPIPEEASPINLINSFQLVPEPELKVMQSDKIQDSNQFPFDNDNKRPQKQIKNNRYSITSINSNHSQDNNFQVFKSSSKTTTPSKFMKLSFSNANSKNHTPKNKNHFLQSNNILDTIKSFSSSSKPAKFTEYSSNNNDDDNFECDENQKIQQQQIQKNSKFLQDQDDDQLIQYEQVKNNNNLQSTTQTKEIRILTNITKDQFFKSYIQGGQKQQTKFLQKKFSLFDRQFLLQSYHCAFFKKILLQGKLFVTNKRLLFYSKFNASISFFQDTCLSIPINEIQDVQKKSNALVFDNSIEIKTIKGANLFFSSFMSRDKAFAIIQKFFTMWNQKQSDQVDNLDDNKQNSNQINRDDLQGGGGGELNEYLRLIEGLEKHRLQCFEDYSPCEHGLYKQTFQNVDIQTVFQALCAQNPNQYSNDVFMIDYNKRKRQTQIQDLKFENKQEIPEYFTKTQDLQEFCQGNKQNLQQIILNWPHFSQRELKFRHSISIPFAPKFTIISDRQRYFWVSPNKFIIEQKCFSSKIPYCDYFYSKFHWIVTQHAKQEQQQQQQQVKNIDQPVEQNKQQEDKQQQPPPQKRKKTSYTCSVQYRFDIIFVKSTIMKSKILKTATEQIKSNLKMISQIVPQYIQNAGQYLKSLRQQGQDNERQANILNDLKQSKIRMLGKIQELQGKLEETQQQRREDVERLERKVTNLGIFTAVAFVVLLLLHILF